jgi:FkbM family methyltransferase
VRDAPVIIECGANDGEDTLAFLERWPNGVVHCFDPEPRAAVLWREKVTSQRAHLYQVALAAQDGEATFHRSDGEFPGDPDQYPGPWNQSGSLRQPTGHLEEWPWVKFEEEITVRTRSLDSWARELGIGEVDLVWADVQGAEEDLVLGGLETLSRSRYLYTEVSDSEYYEGQIDLAGLLRLLPAWRVVARYPGDVLLRNTRYR